MIILISEETDHAETVQMHTDSASLPDVLEFTERFLRAAGFHPKGTLEFVDDELEP